MRYLGIDFGMSHIGLAVGEKIPHEFGTIKYKDLKILVQEVITICEQEKIDAIVIGVPSDNYEESTHKTTLLAFINLLKSHNLDVKTIDESFTSFDSNEILKEAGVDWKKSKERIHQLSAVLILNQYISSQDIK
ncbi:MAG: Holliday junction resolvase RuvX [Patescibacteria group bacterium]|jgi:putative transcription antitermination factor YqgF